MTKIAIKGKPNIHWSDKWRLMTEGLGPNKTIIGCGALEGFNKFKEFGCDSLSFMVPIVKDEFPISCFGSYCVLKRLASLKHGLHIDNWVVVRRSSVFSSWFKNVIILQWFVVWASTVRVECDWLWMILSGNPVGQWWF